MRSKNREGHYKIRLSLKLKSGKVKEVERTMGLWFLEAAIAGELDQLPVLNVK